MFTGLLFKIRPHHARQGVRVRERGGRAELGLPQVPWKEAGQKRVLGQSEDQLLHVGRALQTEGPSGKGLEGRPPAG